MCVSDSAIMWLFVLETCYIVLDVFTISSFFCLLLVVVIANC